jgi:hypothetical protein
MKKQEFLAKWKDWFPHSTRKELLSEMEADLEKIIQNAHNSTLDVEVKRTERGWAGHYHLSNMCKFRRNTLLTYNDIAIVVSSVGLQEINGRFSPIGACGRYFETFVFHANKADKRYFDADTERQIWLDRSCTIDEVDADDRANIMHENIVSEIIVKLKNGDRFE